MIVVSYNNNDMTKVTCINNLYPIALHAIAGSAGVAFQEAIAQVQGAYVE
jgi:hypothetical protein